MHGVRVRCQPETRPREFLSEPARWRCIELSLREARRAIPRSERGMYASFVDAYAYALAKCRYFERLESGEGPSGQAVLFGPED